jgi:membrane-bound lytic murein transglycosylase D
MDLWERIRRGFAMPNLDTDLVRQQEQWYASRPDYLQRMTERSAKYLFHIVDELEQRQMPLELALLPYIESAFNPQATSVARAAGIWQFMPATGTYFDLKQNAFRDDRRDVLQSTRAALDYLQRLHRMFGDWHLALAAYNWGEGNVQRAQQRNQRAGLPTGYLHLNMPDETRQYVPKFQAVKNIIANPAAFRAELPLVENHPYFQTVDITRDIDVELAARLADVRVEDFRALNPSARRPVILAAGTSQILLPWENAKIFERNLDAHAKGRLASWTAWVAPSTMSVTEAAKRTGMSEAELRSINQVPPRMLIRGGATLLVPRAAHHGDVSERVADNGQLLLAPEVSTRRSTVKARKGDTVATLARRHGLSPAQVAHWNDVTPNTPLRAQQNVVVYLRERARPASTGAKRADVRRAAAAPTRTTPKRAEARGTAKPRAASPSARSTSTQPKPAR